MPEKRSTVILNYIRQKEEVTLRELCALYPEYTEMTIRRDLNLLVRNGYITRTHGGAKLNHDILPESHYYHKRSNAMQKEKSRIAIKALDVISGSTLYMDASTTVLALASILPDIPLFIVTNSPVIALEFQHKKNIEVLLTGGSLNKKMLSASGPVALGALDRINIDTAFMSASGMSTKHGFTNGVHSECELKRTAISGAKQVVMMIDNSKFDKILPYTFCGFDDIDILITDSPLPSAFEEKISASSVKVL